MRIAAIDVLAWVLNVASSVAIVFVNKWLMDPVRGHGFVFATCLSAAHFLATGAVCYTGELLGLVKTAEIPILQLMLYTAVASASIASVNLSLLYNSVGFYQISKLATIPVVAALEAVWCGRRFSTPTLMSMAAVAIGSGIVTISDVSLRFTGFVIAAISVVTAALQQIGVGALQRQNAVGPVETLAATAPVQGMCLAAFGPSIDYSLRRAWVFRYPFTVSTGGILALSCVVALLVNLSQTTLDTRKWLGSKTPEWRTCLRPLTRPPNSSRLSSSHRPTRAARLATLARRRRRTRRSARRRPPSSSSSSSSSESESDSESDSSSESESTDSDDDRRKKKKRSKRSKHSSKKKVIKDLYDELLSRRARRRERERDRDDDRERDRNKMKIPMPTFAPGQNAQKFAAAMTVYASLYEQSSKGGALALLAALKDHPDAYAWCSDYVATRKDLDLATVLKAFTKRFSFEKRSRDHKDKINGNKKGNGDNRKGKANDDAKRRRSNDATAPTGVGSRAASDPDGLSAVNINDRFLTNWQWAHAKKFGKCINCWKTGHRNKDCKESAAEPPVRPTA